ncbi:class I SAM-dependent methyltransferase [Microbacterium sp. 1.5R]|uniref:class I SAM-dependent methyltransferase n=1 Tax=Microbacterium sp. 1.5R TaxID=1916917 RepID=UPI0016428DFE|nr:class I SAM-dependent methyltransferase [Microbacterium sp. 1.5R]
MPRLSARDLATIAVLVGFAVAAACLALLGYLEWALVLIAALVALLGLISRVEFAARRGDVRAQMRDVRQSRRLSEGILRLVKATRDDVQRGSTTTVRAMTAASAYAPRQPLGLRGDGQSQVLIEQLAQDMSALRAEIRGMRVAHQLLSQTIISTKDGVVTSAQALEDISSKITRIDRRVRRIEVESVSEEQALLQLLARYTPRTPLPILSGWALSPVGLVYLLDAIEQRDAASVVECGSGTSTLWMALAMKSKGSGKVYALDSSEEYAAETRAMLEAHGLGEWAQVSVCPLTTQSTPRGDLLWYDLAHADLPEVVDVLLVDGPPGTSGPHARYPAVPLLRSRLATDALVMLDDADRPDERDVIGFWADEGLVGTSLTSPHRGIRVFEAHAAR